MLKYYNYDIVFAEIPDEVTLAVNISGCPNHCKGCHSPWLQQDLGNQLDEKAIDLLLAKYSNVITCFCFMGGDNDTKEVERLSLYIKRTYKSIHTAWYSGKQGMATNIDKTSFHYIKIGPYIEKYGPLKTPTTNQRLYKISPSGSMADITNSFWKSI